jgi:hypothetical protein
MYVLCALADTKLNYIRPILDPGKDKKISIDHTKKERQYRDVVRWLQKNLFHGESDQ